MVNGRDTLDEPLEVLPGQDVSGIAATATDRPAEIAGTLLDQLGRPSPDGTPSSCSRPIARTGPPRRAASGASSRRDRTADLP